MGKSEKTVETAVVAATEEVKAVPMAPAFTVETEAQDMIIPFLKVVQAQADEVTPGKDKYNEAVRPGNIYDSTTRTIYDNPEIIICGIRKYYGEWKGDVRGELVGKHKIDSDIIKNAKRIPQTSAKGIPYFDLESANGNRLEETFGVVCIVKNKGVILPATFTLSKSAFTVGKTLNTMLAMYQAQGVPKFHFKTNAKTNDKGSWFVPVFDFAGYETDANVISLAQTLQQGVDKIIFTVNATEQQGEEIENVDVV